MAFNIWAAQGSIAPGGSLGAYSNPNVLYESPKVVIGGGGSCFKLWCSPKNGGTGIYYFESNDGLTSWAAHPSNPIVAASAGNSFPTLYKVGSTYYLYTGPFPGGAGISVRTSSDGVTFGAPSLAIPIGAGSWESTGVAQLNLVPGTSSPYVAYYEGVGASGSAEISATSTDLINWTKGNVTNPVFQGVAPLTFQYINGIYYAWGPNGSVPPSLNPGQALGYNGITRWSASNPLGPWTSLKVPGSLTQPAAVIYPSIRADLDNTGTNSNTVGANISDPYILSALGNMYFYWSQTSPVGVQNNINCAVATGVTPAQQVSGYEGMQSFPMPMFDGNLSVLASDNFTRANANPIGGNWSPLVAAGVFNQISGNFCEAAAAPPSNGQSYYNAVSFPADSWSEVTVHNSAHGAITGTMTRMSTSGVNSTYLGYWAGNTGSNGTLNLGKAVTGTPTTLGTVSGLKVSAGDTLMIAVSGTNLLVYYNGFPVLAATDASLATGAAGLWNNAPVAVTDSQINLWRGGGFQANSFVPPSLGGSIYAIGSSNRWTSQGLTPQAIF